ncbi:MAG: beta-ketoacyl-ACP synthase II [Myxococcales bacterium]|nr:beta-ketoacyl-ACP synthase II [Myxococcales bacterium]
MQSDRRDGVRVAVTGLGLVTPLGLDRATSWAALLAGRHGAGPITRFDASAYRTRFACEVKDFDPETFIERKKVKECDRFIQFALAAAQMAWQDAGLGASLGPVARERMGCIIGSGMGGLETIERQYEVLKARGPSKLSPYFVPSTIANLAAGQVAMRLGLRGINYCTMSACASGAHAIGEGFRLIARGLQDVMVVGGAEASITQLGIGGFNAMLALSTRNDDPAGASRPFDAGRDGFVMGEGAGVLVLESYERAVARGATVYAELVGYGATDDAHHLTQPAPEGEGAQRAMAQCLAEAGIDPEVVGHVNAHATSTPVGDVQEAQGLAAIFGAHLPAVAVAATKSMTGHLLGAAGGVEAAFTVLSLHTQTVPPTANLTAPDPACALSLSTEARPVSMRYALSNSFGFGGTNVSLLFARCER